MPLFSLSLLCGMGEGRVRVLLIALVFDAVTPYKEVNNVPPHPTLSLKGRGNKGDTGN